MIKKYGIFFAWLVSLIATLVSLYFSEIKDYPPCNLCWYQRIAMYPLVIILGIALIKKSREIVSYVLPLPIIGGFIALYQYYLQKFNVSESTICGPGMDCTTQYINWLGFITIPFLSAVGFVLITIFLFYGKEK